MARALRSGAEAGKAKPFRVAFRADAGPVMGSGHVMRCLTLAAELRRRGAEVALVAAALPDRLAARAGREGVFVHGIAAAGPPPAGEGWERTPLSDAVQSTDAERFRAALTAEPDLVVVDHYRLDTRWEAAAGAPVMAIDDLANRPHACRLLLDQTLGRQAGDYAPHVSPDAALLLGPSHALLRPGFAAERPAAQARRGASTTVERLLVAIGGGCDDGLTARMVTAVRRAGFEGRIDAIVGEATPDLADGDRLSVHVDVADMAPLLRDADLAIGAAGASSWERCALGLPTLMLVRADNQAGIARALDAAGAAVACRLDDDSIGRALVALLADGARRARMSAAAFAVTDGLGAGRVADRIVGEFVHAHA